MNPIQTAISALETKLKTWVRDEIQKAMNFATTKYGDTPTDANQLTPKKYVDANSGGSPAGSDTQVQFNDAGSFGASSGFTFDSSSSILSAPIGQIPLFNSTIEVQGNIISDLNLFVSTPGQYFGFGPVFQTGAKSVLYQTATIATTDATPTVLWQGSTSNPRVIQVEATVVGRCTGGAGGNITKAGGYVRRVVARDNGGSIAIVGSVQDSFTAEDVSGWDVTFVTSGVSTLQLQVTGGATDNITWFAFPKLLTVD